MAILGQTALLTGLLVYFGWTRSQTTYGYFGLSAKLVGLSSSDLVLASVDSAYDPLLLLGFAFFIGAVVHARVARHPQHGATLRKRTTLVATAFVVIGTISRLSNWVAHQIGSIVPDDPGLAFAWLPTSLVIGFSLLAYVSATMPEGETDLWLRGGVTMTFVLVGLSTLALFWTVSLLAVRDGRERAYDIENRDAALSEVAVLSHDDLLIEGPRVIYTPLNLPDARFRHQYAGLRLLGYGNGKYFLLPLGWRHGHDRVYTVADKPDTRVEIIAH